MALLDIFKKKKKEKPEKKEKKTEKRAEKKPASAKATVGKEIKKELKKEVSAPVSKRKIIYPESYRILKIPHVSEKATDLTKENQYIFRIFQSANKNEVKRAVSGLYRVDVLSVRIINIPSKRRRVGRTQGFRQGYKKAIVRIKEGQKIEVLPR